MGMLQVRVLWCGMFWGLGGYRVRVMVFGLYGFKVFGLRVCW